MRKILEINMKKCLFINGMQFDYVDRYQGVYNQVYTRNGKELYVSVDDDYRNGVSFTICNDDGNFLIVKKSKNITLYIEESTKYRKMYVNEKGTFFQSIDNPADIVLFAFTSYGYCLYEVSSTKTFIVYDKDVKIRKHHWEAVLENGILLKIYDKYALYGGIRLKSRRCLPRFFSSAEYFDDDYISVNIGEKDANRTVKVHYADNKFLAAMGLLM